MIRRLDSILSVKYILLITENDIKDPYCFLSGVLKLRIYDSQCRDLLPAIRFSYIRHDCTVQAFQIKLC